MRNYCPKMKKFSIIVGIFLALVVIGGFFYFKYSHHFALKIDRSQAPQLTSGAISTIIVPHHDLVKDKRADFFKTIKGEVNPKTVILISPNHFDNGNFGFVSASADGWNNKNGISLASDKIDQLIKLGNVGQDDSVFVREHGINNILPDIKSTFPSADIIPIAIKQTVDLAATNTLFENLNAVCAQNCLLVASIDFSHYQPGALSEVHDQTTLRAIDGLDENAAWNSEVDSDQSLVLAIKWAKLHNTDTFNLFLNTNSGKLTDDRDAESTSYVLGDYSAGTEKKSPESVSFLVGGDVMLDRAIDYNFRDNKIFDLGSNLGDRLFWGTDLSMVNLEGPISDQPIPADETANNLIFNFPPTTPEFLKQLHINAVSLANNHIDNNGSAGVINTKNVLSKDNIVPIGQGSFYSDSSVAYFGDNQKLAVITVLAIDGGDQGVSALIKKNKAAGKYVLVFPHWGVEYEKTHSPEQEKLAHLWVDAGADIVIGSHPHVVEDAEIYRNRPIFYSLGNLIFDQTFSADTQEGLLIGGMISDSGINLVLLPVISHNYKPQLMTGEDKTAVIDNFRQMLDHNTSNKGYGYDKVEIQY